jgi:hypothetical protein
VREQRQVSGCLRHAAHTNLPLPIKLL